MSTYYANDRYAAVLTAGYSVGQTTLYVSAVPNHVPTIIVAAKGTDNETVFAVTDKTSNSLTGVSRLRGANVDLDAQTPLTCLNNEEFQNQYASIYNQLINGWMPAEETWTYASATTITVPSGAASKYSKGDKIRLKQGAGYKYFYVVGIADTVLTVTGGSDHTVANAAITDNYYSKVENPQGFPHWFNFTPTWDVGSIDNGSGGQPTNSFDKFMITGKQVFVQIKVSGTKANTTDYIRFQSSHLPNPAYTAGSQAFGSVACGTTSWGGGFVQYTASYHALTFFSNINDNTAINPATSSYSYEF